MHPRSTFNTTPQARNRQITRGGATGKWVKVDVELICWMHACVLSGPIGVEDVRISVQASTPHPALRAQKVLKTTN